MVFLVSILLGTCLPMVWSQTEDIEMTSPVQDQDILSTDTISITWTVTTSFAPFVDLHLLVFDSGSQGPYVSAYGINVMDRSYTMTIPRTTPSYRYYIAMTVTGTGNAVAWAPQVGAFASNSFNISRVGCANHDDGCSSSQYCDLDGYCYDCSYCRDLLDAYDAVCPTKCGSPSLLAVGSMIPESNETVASGPVRLAVMPGSSPYNALTLSNVAGVSYGPNTSESFPELMTTRLDEKLRALAQAVAGNTQFTSVAATLRVTQAYTIAQSGAAVTYFNEGRAALLQLSACSDAPACAGQTLNGLLARLAVQAGFDFVHYSSVDTVYVSVVPDACDAPVDLLFLLDSSMSIEDPSSGGVPGYFHDKVLQFTSNVSRLFNVGQGMEQTRVSVGSFSTATSVEFLLNENADISQTVSDIQSIAYMRAQTHTREGLQMVRENMLLPSAGLRNTSQIPAVLVVVTDGQANFNHEPYSEADLLHALDYLTVITVGVGLSVDTVELNYMASAPQVNNTFLIKSYRGAERIVNRIGQVACDIKPKLTCGDTISATSIKDGSFKYIEITNHFSNYILVQATASTGNISIFASEWNELPGPLSYTEAGQGTGDAKEILFAVPVQGAAVYASFLGIALGTNTFTGSITCLNATTAAPSPPPAPTSAAPTQTPTSAAPTQTPTSAAPTAVPTTVAPTRTPTHAPTFEPTFAPVTFAPVTVAPVTAAPVSAAPITAAPVTVAPTTFAPTASVAPTTGAPTTDAPVDATTVAPTTDAPVGTPPPATAAPITVAPTVVTAGPVTTAPTTLAPVTTAPTTDAPVVSNTAAPTTDAPVTAAPAPTITFAPVTAAPTTRSPTTQAPTTLAPTTVAPTTRSPTYPGGVICIGPSCTDTGPGGTTTTTTQTGVAAATTEILHSTNGNNLGSTGYYFWGCCGLIDIKENESIGYSVANVSVRSTASGSPVAGVSYTLSAGSATRQRRADALPFAIDPTTGEITLSGAIDFETTPWYDLIVAASLGGSAVVESNLNATISAVACPDGLWSSTGTYSCSSYTPCDGAGQVELVAPTPTSDRQCSELQSSDDGGGNDTGTAVGVGLGLLFLLLLCLLLAFFMVRRRRDEEKDGGEVSSELGNNSSVNPLHGNDLSLVAAPPVTKANAVCDKTFNRVVAYDHMYHGNPALTINDESIRTVYKLLQLEPPPLGDIPSKRRATRSFLDQTVAAPRDVDAVIAEAVEFKARAMPDVLVDRAIDAFLLGKKSTSKDMQQLWKQVEHAETNPALASTSDVNFPPRVPLTPLTDYERAQQRNPQPVYDKSGAMKGGLADYFAAALRGEDTTAAAPVYEDAGKQQPTRGSNPYDTSGNGACNDPEYGVANGADGNRSEADYDAAGLRPRTNSYDAAMMLDINTSHEEPDYQMASGRNVAQQQRELADYDVASAVRGGNVHGQSPYDSAHNVPPHGTSNGQPMYDNAQRDTQHSGQATYDNAAHGRVAAYDAAGTHIAPASYESAQAYGVQQQADYDTADGVGTMPNGRGNADYGVASNAPSTQPDYDNPHNSNMAGRNGTALIVPEEVDYDVADAVKARTIAPQKQQLSGEADYALGAADPVLTLHNTTGTTTRTGKRPPADSPVEDITYDNEFVLSDDQASIRIASVRRANPAYRSSAFITGGAAIAEEEAA
eukprot:m.1141963 g.1141963  ORF g.1141963 m.1141963 type:complete len:1660 (+) comp24452_c1_seq1:322-5301(+)